MMNKLLQHIMNAGGGSDKFLPYLEQFQTKGEYKGKSPLLQLAARQAPVYDNIPNPAIYRAKAEMDMKAKQQAAINVMREKQGEIRPADPKRSAMSKALAIAAHPMTAAQYVLKGQDIPDNFEKGSLNLYDFATPFLNPASAIYAGAQIPGNLKDAEFLQAGLNSLAVFPGLTTVPKATRGVLNAADRNFSKVGKALSAIEKEGRALGLSDFEIGKRQLDQVGITSNQRQAYIPGVSDVVRRYVTPYGYSGMGSGTKLKEIVDNIKRGGIDVDASQVSASRGDAWRMYLGMPQKNRTFRLAETAPVNHRAYTSKQLKDMDIYSLNREAEIADDLLKSTDNTTPFGTRNSVDNIKAESFVEVDPVDVMGNYNARFTTDGLQYNDIWDLNPSIALVKLLPKKLRTTLQDNPLFYSEKKFDNLRSLYTPRKVTLSVDKFIGKPFMSHGNLGLTARQYQNSVIKAIEDRLHNYKNYELLGDMTPSINRLTEQLEQVKNVKPIKEEGGEADEPKQYKGSSIVDYLATKGYSGKKAFRKGLAEEYGVEDYDFSAKKNLELLARMRENDELLRAKKEDFAPIPIERIEEIYAERAAQQPSVQPIVNAVQEQKEAEKQKRLNDLRRRMTLELGFDPFVEGPKVKKIESPKFSLSSKNPYGAFNLFTGFGNQGSTKQQQAAPLNLPPSVNRYVKSVAERSNIPSFQQFPEMPQRPEPAPQSVVDVATSQSVTPGFRFDKAPVPKPGSFFEFQQFAPYPTKQMAQLPKGRTAEVAAKQLEKEEDNRAWYEKLWDSYSEAVNNSQIFGKGRSGITLGGAGFTPEGAKMMTRDFTKGVLSVVSEDLAEKYKNKMERQDAKLNPNERKSSLDPSKVMFDPVYVTGDTIPDTKRRYHIPEVMDLDYMRFGVRNRGDLREIQTEGAPITTFTPFQSSKQYFAKTKDPANATYVGVAADGRIKVGGRDQFQDQDYQVTRTFGNKVVDFNRDAAGSIAKVPSNPKASKETLSPSVKVLNDDGKVVDGKLSLLLPRTGNQEESFDLVTGGRYILQTPDGKTKLVSGSLKNIEGEFYKMKKNHPWVNVITLDNGSYARGIRTFDKKLTKQDLKGYDNQNSGGGNFAYILPGERKTRYESKFTDFEAEAKRRLQSMYPGKNVSVGFQNTGLYDQTGGRDIESQVSIQKKGNSQTPVSLHNFGAAKDYILYVDGKPIDADKNKKLYKDVLWGAADKAGLYHLEDWDPAHISLAKEGQKTAFDELYTKYPDLFAHPNFVRSLNYVNKNKNNPLYEEYYELLNNLQLFTGKPRTTEVMKRTMAKKAEGGPIVSEYGQWAYPGMDTIVPSGDITMKGVPYPVYGQDETGYGQMMYPGGEYVFPGQMVYEKPMMQKGGSLSTYQIRGQVNFERPRAVASSTNSGIDGGLWNKNKAQWADSVNHANIDKNFVQRYYLKNGPSMQIPGKEGTSTHYMEESDGMVYPTVVQYPGDAFLQYLNASDKNGAYNYAKKTGQFIKFPTIEQARWYADNGYKNAKGVMIGKKKYGGGELPTYQTRGEVRRAPIYVDNPRDPRLRAYNDSLSLYNQTQSNIMSRGWGKYMTSREIEKQFQKYGPYEIGHMKTSPTASEWYARSSENNSPTGTGETSNWDSGFKNKVNRKILPVGRYIFKSGDNSADFIPKYKKPVQPVVYRKPQPKKQELVMQVQQTAPQQVVPTPAPLRQYSGSPVYSPGAGSGMPSALVGFRSQTGDTTFIQPEDYERFAVPAYGKQYIESQTKQFGGGGQHGGLDRWFAEKWVDVKTGKDCGRQEGESRAGYPACRPSKRVSSKTPKTSSEMSPAEKAKFKRTKTSSERIPYNHKRK